MLSPNFQWCLQMEVCYSAPCSLLSSPCPSTCFFFIQSSWVSMTTLLFHRARLSIFSFSSCSFFYSFNGSLMKVKPYQSRTLLEMWIFEFQLATWSKQSLVCNVFHVIFFFEYDVWCLPAWAQSSNANLSEQPNVMLTIPRLLLLSFGYTSMFGFHSCSSNACTTFE